MSDYSINSSLDTGAFPLLSAEDFPSLTAENLLRVKEEKEKEVSGIIASALDSKTPMKKKSFTGKKMSLEETGNYFTSLSKSPAPTASVSSLDSSLKTPSNDSINPSPYSFYGYTSSEGRTTPESMESSTTPSPTNRTNFKKGNRQKGVNKSDNRPMVKTPEKGVQGVKVHYKPRVVRWLKLPTPDQIGGLLNHASAIRNYPGYEYVSNRDAYKTHVYHGFTTYVDRFSSLALPTTHTNPKSGEKSRTRLIPAKMDYEGIGSTKGFISYTYDKGNNCYHRFFHEADNPSTLSGLLDNYDMSKTDKQLIINSLFSSSFFPQLEVDDRKFGGKITLINLAS